MPASPDAIRAEMPSSFAPDPTERKNSEEAPGPEVLRGRGGPDAFGYRWIDYNLRPDIQEKWVREFYISPANTKVEVPDDLKELIPISGERTDEIVTFDWARANAERDQIIERWNKTMR